MRRGLGPSLAEINLDMTVRKKEGPGDTGPRPEGTASPAPRWANLIVARQLDDMNAGNTAYLLVLLRTMRRGGLSVRVVFAPRRSFGNRPFMRIHPQVQAEIGEVVCPQSLRIGGVYISLSPTVWGRFIIRLLREARRRTGGHVPIRSLLSAPLDLTEASSLASASDRHACALVIAEYSNLAPVLDLMKSGAVKSVFLHDLFSLRAQAFRARGEAPDHADISLEEEAAWVRPADVQIYASANELAALSPLTPGARGVWMRPDVPDYPDVRTDDVTPRAVFLGTRHAGNTDALRHLLDDIWPRVLARRPEAQLWIAGSTCSVMTPDDLTRPGVRALGRVGDLASIGGPASIGLAPTRIASGVSIKVAEYLRLGMPCIAYPVALEGFGRALDDLADTVEGPDAFAARLADLLDDDAGRSKRSQKARDQIGARLDNEELAAVFRAL